MRKLIATAFVLGALFAGPASSAAVLYSNGPVDGTNNLWAISGAYQVADSFTLSGASTLTGVDFGAWLFPGDTGVSIDWSITTAAGGGSILDSGTGLLTNNFLFTNGYGYDIYEESFSLAPLNLGAGTYWLQLENGVTTKNTHGIYWDQSNGPSQAWSNTFGSLQNCDFQGSTCSESFDILGETGAVPEPATIALFGMGLVGLAGLRRRKTN